MILRHMELLSSHSTELPFSEGHFFQDLSTPCGPPESGEIPYLEGKPALLPKVLHWAFEYAETYIH